MWSMTTKVWPRSNIWRSRFQVLEMVRDLALDLTITWSWYPTRSSQVSLCKWAEKPWTASPLSQMICDITAPFHPHFPTPLLSQLGNILSGWCGCHFYSYSLAQLSDCGLCFRVSLFVHHDNNSFSLSCAITSLNTIHHFLSHALYPWSPDLSLYSWKWNNQHWKWQDGRDYIHYIDMEISCLPESIESRWWEV